MPQASSSPWVTDANAALLTDFYQLTMLQAYWAEAMTGRAVFSLFARRLPENRNYLLACGLDDALRYLERCRVPAAGLDFLRRRTEFREDFVDWLGSLRFRGDVWAVLEGTPVFADEPLLEVAASLPEAQIAETFLMNQIHLQTVLASKAVRVLHAARGRTVVDFGLRRMHGTDAGLKGARAFHVAGLAGTSNVLAGRVYGMALSGTVAHSYVQAHDDELESFRAFARLYPESTLLVDTYDTLAGVRKLVKLAEELGEDFRIGAIRLDSGDLVRLAFAARTILDEAGLRAVRIFASGGLDEWEIDAILRSGAPVDGFGVGTRMGVAHDAPSLDMAYKLVEYAGTGRLKLSPGKPVLPGRKQIYRVEEGERAVRDLIATADEEPLGRPLLVKVMEKGQRLPAARASLDEARARASREIGRLPEPVRALEPALPPYPVEPSRALVERSEAARRHVEEQA